MELWFGLPVVVAGAYGAEFQFEAFVWLGCGCWVVARYLAICRCGGSMLEWLLLLLLLILFGGSVEAHGGGVWLCLWWWRWWRRLCATPGIGGHDCDVCE